MTAPPLTSEQLAELRQALVAERHRLQGHLQLTKTGARPVDLDTPIGRLSRMDAIQQQQMTRAERSSLAVKLRQVEASLAAHGNGTYGFCRSCDDPISYSRLTARPEAPFCLNCQNTRERRSV